MKRETSAKFVEAAKLQNALIRRAQIVLTKYLQGPPSGITQNQMTNEILFLFDGPDQRQVQKIFDEAIAGESE